MVSTTRAPGSRPAPSWCVTLPPPAPIAAGARGDPARRSSTRTTHLIVIDKPAGPRRASGARARRPARWSTRCCTTPAARLSGIGGRLRPGIVHRIDKDTSGLLVVAKTDAAHQGLPAQFAAHDLERRYLAVVHGAPDPAEPRLRHLPGIGWEPGGVLRIEGRDRPAPGRPQADGGAERRRQAGGDAGAGARAVRRRAALVECRLETGRTHQIRVHMSFAGHPLVGDAVYGRRRRRGAARRRSRGRRCTRRASGSCIR